MTLQRIMLDSNIFDEVAKNKSIFKTAVEHGIVDFYVTSIQIEEIASIPDTKKEKRICIFQSFTELRPRIVPTPFSFSRIDFANVSFEPGPDFSFIPNGSEKDRLIAETAIHEKCTFVTNDDRLVKRIKKRGYPAMRYDEFIDALKSTI